MTGEINENIVMLERQWFMIHRQNMKNFGKVRERISVPMTNFLHFSFLSSKRESEGREIKLLDLRSFLISQGES